MHLLQVWLVEDRSRATAVTTVLLALALVSGLYPLLLASAVPLALSAMRQGAAGALRILLPAAALVTLLALLGGYPPGPGLALMASFWLPALGCALLLAKTESQGAMLALTCGFAALWLFGVYLTLDDPAAHWQQLLQPLLQQHFPQRPQLLEMLPRALTPGVAILLMFGLCCALWTARWLQAAFYNPGGFHQEYARLRLPWWMGTAPLVVMLIPWGEAERARDLAEDLLVVLLALYLLAGIAAGYRIVRHLGLSWRWSLVGAGCALLLLPSYVLVLVAMLGWGDTLLGLLEPAERDRQE